MNFTKLLFAVLMVSLFFVASGFAAEWKDLHEKADSLTLNQAQVLVKASPESADNLYVLGLVYLNLHQDLQAQDVFKKALDANKQMYWAKWGLAESLRRQHRSDMAEPILNEVLTINAQFPPACVSLAYIKYMRMDFDGSVKLALKVIDQGRERVDLSNYVRGLALYAGAKGMIAHYGGVLSKAINGLAVKPNLDKAEKLQPDSPAVLFGLGSYYFLAPVIAGGDKNKAEVYLKRAIEADPLFTDAYVRLAQLYNIRKDRNKYDLYMSKAVDIDPSNELILDARSGKCKFICMGGEERR